MNEVRYKNDMVTKSTYDLLKALVSNKSPERVFCATSNVRHCQLHIFNFDELLLT